MVGSQQPVQCKQKDVFLIPPPKKKPMAAPVQSRYLQCNVQILSNGVYKEGCVVVQ